MQIHEIFRPRANESILKGIKNAAASVARAAPAVASHIGGQILAKAGLDANTGLGTENPFGDKEAEAAKAAEPIIKNQAASLQKKWAETKNANPAALKQSLDRVLHNILLQRKIGNDYKDISNWVSTDPAIQQRATALENQIEKSFDSIIAAGPAATVQNWEALVRSATQAMQLITFHPKKYSYGGTAMPAVSVTPTGWNIGNTVLTPSNPAHNTIIQILNAQQQQTGTVPKLKPNPQGIMIGTQLVGKNQPAYQFLSTIVNNTQSATPAATTKPSSGASLGGEPLDPSDPASQKILAAMQKQGKI